MTFSIVPTVESWSGGEGPEYRRWTAKQAGCLDVLGGCYIEVSSTISGAVPPSCCSNFCSSGLGDREGEE
jgi:hypothetical protein